MSLRALERNLIVDFVQNVQDAFTVLALTDPKLERLVKGGLKEVPRPLVFEILTRQEAPDRPGAGEAAFVPHVSRRLDDFRHRKAREHALTLLSENSKLIALADRVPLEWQPLCAAAADVERMAGEPGVEQLLAAMLAYYRRALIPTNIAASALVHQAWKRGLLHRNPERVRKAFFLRARSQSVEGLLERMANVVFQVPISLGARLPDDGRLWQVSADSTGLFLWIEYSLVHRFLHTRKARTWTLVHYPLVIDSYWFVGFAYFLEGDIQKPLAEAFNSLKYYKCRALLTDLVAEPLRAALYQDALAKLEVQGLLDGTLPFEEVYLRLLQNLFPCFGCRKVADKRPAGLQQLIEYRGVVVYGPAWIRGSRNRGILRLLRQEIERRGEDLAIEIDRRRQRDALAREEEAKVQIERWAHNMQTKLLPASIWAKDLLLGLESTNESGGKLAALASQIEVLRRTAQTLSRFGRVEEWLRERRTSIRDLANEAAHSAATLQGVTVALAGVLFESLLLMVMRIVDRDDPAFEPAATQMPRFSERCERWLPAAIELWGRLATDTPPVITISQLSELADGEEFTFQVILPNGYQELDKFRLWMGVEIGKAAGFRCDTAIGMVFDNVLSNACRYVDSVGGHGRARIDLKLEVHGHADLRRKEVLMADLELSNTANMHSQIETTDLLAAFSTKRHGLASCRDTAVLLTGAASDFTSSITPDREHVVTHFRFPVVFD